MFFKPIVLVFFLSFSSFGLAQTFKVVDNKGTLMELEKGLGNVAELYIGAIVSPQTLSKDFDDILFTNSGIVDESDFSVNVNSITVKKRGRYEIVYRVSTYNDNNERSGGEFYLDINNVESYGTRAYTYSRNSTVGYNTVSVVKVLDLDSNTVIKLKGKVYSSTSSFFSLKLSDNGSSLIVKRIK